MKYFATFSDGTTFQQPEDDVSVLDPSKSAFFDFLEHAKGRELREFSLIGGGASATVVHPEGLFFVNGQPVEVGSDLPEGFEWVEGLPDHGVYFQVVKQHLNAEFVELSCERQFCVGVKAIPGVKNFLGVK